VSRKKKILIVEDDEQFRDMLSMRFQSQGYAVVHAKDGEEAFAQLRKEEPDLMILDLMLPKIEGFEVCRILKFEDKYKDLPIIIATALGQREHIERAINSGADAYFIKPFDMDTLLAKIASFIG
jgi:DNA-binding response OmpR family regulator